MAGHRPFTTLFEEMAAKDPDFKRRVAIEYAALAMTGAVAQILNRKKLVNWNAANRFQVYGKLAELTGWSTLKVKRFFKECYDIGFTKHILDKIGYVIIGFETEQIENNKGDWVSEQIVQFKLFGRVINYSHRFCCLRVSHHSGWSYWKIKKFFENPTDIRDTADILYRIGYKIVGFVIEKKR